MLQAGSGRDVATAQELRLFRNKLLRSRRRRVHAVGLGGLKPERSQPLAWDLGRVDLGKTKRPRANTGEQERQPRPVILDERPQRDDVAARQIQDVSLELLIGCDGKSRDVALPGRECFD